MVMCGVMNAVFRRGERKAWALVAAVGIALFGAGLAAGIVLY
jgi:hypothetical protein